MLQPYTEVLCLFNLCEPWRATGYITLKCILVLNYELSAKTIKNLISSRVQYETLPALKKRDNVI